MLQWKRFNVDVEGKGALKRTIRKNEVVSAKNDVMVVKPSQYFHNDYHYI